MIAATLFEHLDVPPAVQHVKISVIDKLVFISYVNYSEGQKVIKLKACPLIVFDSETGKYLRHAMLPAIGYANMGVLESKKLLVLIA